MTEMTFEQERNLGIRIARKEGLKKTEKVIKNYGCYREIFNALYNEAGEIKSLELIRESNNPCWAHLFARYVSGISRETIESLAQVVIESKHPCWAYDFAWDVSGISRETKESLARVVIESNDSYWAYWFAWDVSGISEDTREKLRAVTG